MKPALLLALAALLLLAASRPAWAAGEESFGNAPLHEANYRDWPGIMPVINHPARVYRYWVNGNEGFFYRGNTAALNEALQRFAGAAGKGWTVVLRPGPGITHSFNREKEIAFNWNLQVIGGIARHLTKLEQGDKVWSSQPVLTVYTGGDIDLAKVELPKGLTVLSVTEVRRRTAEGLKSPDKTVRGWGAGALAALDPFDAGSRDLIAGLLTDPDNWVRLNAASALASFGRQAEPALPALREAEKTDDQQLRERVRESIRTIETAPERAGAARAHQEALDRIQQLLASRKG